VHAPMLAGLEREYKWWPMARHQDRFRLPGQGADNEDGPKKRSAKRGHRRLTQARRLWIPRPKPDSVDICRCC
jgi:hypothetical protein